MESSWVVLLLHFTGCICLSPKTVQGLELQGSAPGMIVYLSLELIYFRAGKGGPWGHLKRLEWRIMNLSPEM